VMASTFLLLLYFLIRAGFNIVLLLLNVVFVFASAAANAQIAIGPLLSCLAPPAFSSYTFDVPCLASIDDITAPGTLHLATVLGAITSFSVSLFWFTHRHAPWMWLLQDSLSVAICLLFVRTLRLPSLRLATLFLGLMFAYDVFMVFISPLIFHTSIMMTVATAGEPTASVSTSGKCERTDGETMPMLMLIPRLNPEASLLEHIYPPPPEHHHGWAWRLSGAAGSFAMIGLGDIVLPALAIAYGRRIDLSLRPTPRRPSSPRTRPCRKCGGFRGLAVGGVGYFSCAVVGYAIGLAITLAANAYGLTFNGVQGQPALLYLVPGVLGALLLRACTRSQLAEVWTGSSLPSSSLDEDSDGSGSSSHPLEPHGGHEGSSCCCDYKRM